MPYRDLKKRRVQNRQASEKWRKKNPEAARWKSRLNLWRNKYEIDLTKEEYEILLECQGGVCALCRRPPIKHSLHVDHNHKNRVIRGLLCGSCNRALGYFKDDAVLLRLAAEYVDRWS